MNGTYVSCISCIAGGFFQSWEAWRVETVEDDLRRAESLKEKCQGKAVLDFGCGNGGFLREIKKYAFEAVGVELDNQARIKIAEEGIEVKSRIEEWKTKQFDVITMFQVIEHLNNPEEYLNKMNTFLKPGRLSENSVNNLGFQTDDKDKYICR